MYKLIKQGNNTFFVDAAGSAAIVDNFLYINGEKASEGSYTFPTDTGDKVVTTGSSGEVISYA
jgi:hypothetical protein